MISQHGQGSGNVQIAVASSSHITINISGQDALDFVAPAFPKQLPVENVREIDLLKAAYAATGFVGRSDLLNEFADWCAHQREVSARILIGAGGAGKTRFAYELYRYVRQQRWGAYFVHFLSSEVRGANLWAHIGSDNALLIIDYASDFTKCVAELLRPLLEPGPPGRKLRLLLLARTGDWDEGWLSSLRSGRSGREVDRLFHPRDPIKLRPLSPADRYSIFAQMLSRMAAFGHDPPPVLPSQQAFERPGVAERLSDPLTLMMSAAAAVRSGPAAALHLSRTKLAFETAKELVAGRMKDAVQTHQQLFLHMAAYTTIRGGMDKDEALVALEEESAHTHLGRVADPGWFLNTLQSWLPGETTWLGTIQPDIVGEAFVLGEKKPMFLLNPEAAILRAAERKAERTISTVVRIAQDFSFAADEIREEPIKWIEQLIEKGEADGSWEYLVRLSDQIPETTLSLRGIGLRISEKLFARATAAAEKGEGPEARLLLAALDVLSMRQGAAGRHDEALATAKRAVSWQRQAVEKGGDAYLLGLAGALNNLSVLAADLGKHEEALAAAQEAEDIYRRRVQRDDPEAINNWTKTLQTLASRQSEAGQWRVALANASQAVELLRECLRIDRRTYLPSFAGSLSNLSMFQADAQQPVEALASAEEATEFFRELAEFRRDEFLQSLAQSLDTLASQQRGVFRPGEALISVTESVSIWRELVKVDRQPFLSDLAASAHNLSLIQREAGERTAALASAQEAVELWRELTAINRAAYIHGLASSLHNLSFQYGNTDPRAHAYVQEAISLWREIVATRRNEFLPDLAVALNDFAAMQAMNSPKDAIPILNETVSLWLEMVRSNPIFLPNLAKSITNLAEQHNRFGEYARAVAVAEEGTLLYRILIEKSNHSWLAPQQARVQSYLGTAHAGLENWPAATAAFEKALHILLDWVEGKPGTLATFGAKLRNDYLAAANAASLEPDTDLIKEANRVLSQDTGSN